MSIRPTPKAPKFGAWLQLQRGGRSLEQIAHKIRPFVSSLGLKVNRSVIQKFEKGRVPSWPMLAAFSRAYDVPIEETVQRLVSALEIPGASDLIRHVGAGEQTPHQPGGVDGPIETRLRERLDRAEQERDVYKKILARAGELTGELADVLRAQGGSPASPQAARRRGPRRNR